MTTLCSISGTLILPTGELLPQATVRFSSTQAAPYAADAQDTVVPRQFTATSDANGEVAFVAIPGPYLGRVDGRAVFSITVPDAPFAVLAQIIDAPPPPTLDAAQQAVLAAQAARDQANVHKVAAEAARVGAETAETGAQAAEAGALASEQAAAGSASAALASEQAAAGSAGAALASEQAASGSASAAAASAAEADADRIAIQEASLWLIAETTNSATLGVGDLVLASEDDETLTVAGTPFTIPTLTLEIAEMPT